MEYDSETTAVIVVDASNKRHEPEFTAAIPGINETLTRTDCDLFYSLRNGELHERVVVDEPHQIVEQQFSDAFVDTHLDASLEQQGVDTVIICGWNVFGTAAVANDCGYDVYVVSDAVANVDEDSIDRDLDAVDEMCGETITTEEL